MDSLVILDFLTFMVYTICFDHYLVVSVNPFAKTHPILQFLHEKDTGSVKDGP